LPGSGALNSVYCQEYQEAHLSTVMLPIKFEDLLELVTRLSPEQKRMLRQRMDEDWSARFGKALDAIHAEIPPDISEEEAQTDIEEAIHQVRADKM
jgi:hypothetical protein